MKDASPTRSLPGTYLRPFLQALAGPVWCSLCVLAGSWCSVSAIVHAAENRPEAAAAQDEADSARERGLDLSTADALPSLQAPGLGERGALIGIRIESGRTVDGQVRIVGRNASQQVVVTGEYATGQLHDLTREVELEVADERVAVVDETGHVVPVGDGQTTLEATYEAGNDNNFRHSLNLIVSHIAQDVPVNFPNQIVPIFTKYGCNGGGCHGKSGGQNGFRLSLLGFEPAEDFEYLVKEGRGRRLFPSAPERSLLLTKATGQLPHGGGQRFDTNSPSYRLLHAWIEQGMPYGDEADPKVSRIEILPQQRLMERGQSQQLIAIAHYSDGSTADVTRMTQFDSNDGEMAEVSPTGLATTGEQTGAVAVMARYQGHVGVFRATMPLGVEIGNLPESKGFVDELVFQRLRELGLPSSELTDESTFLRRVTIDIAGRLPTVAETEQFLASSDPRKREHLVDRLLASADYAEYFANKWSSILRNKRRADYEKPATFGFHAWVRQALLENRPYDEFVRDIITASGTPQTNPAVAWYREVKDEFAQVEDTAQLFLGLRLQCARCHHHPFEVWSQQDYYGFAAFFSRVGRKKGMLRNEARIFHNPGRPQSRNPKTKQNVPPTGLGDEPAVIDDLQDPRFVLADWMADPNNPFFAKALVNRYWKHFFGRGLVDPEDDMRLTNPASQPELLEALAADFVQHDYDLKHLVRTICNSNTYQLSSEPHQWNADDKQNFSRYYPRRLNAEVLLDAIDQVTGTRSKFRGAPAGTRAVQLPDSGFNSYFLTVFGKPEASTACECERSTDANLAQSLHLLNSKELQSKLTSEEGRAAQFAHRDEQGHRQKIRELYLTALSREPQSEEIEIALGHIRKCEDDEQRAYEDIVWALLNTKEFLFNH